MSHRAALLLARRVALSPSVVHTSALSTCARRSYSSQADPHLPDSVKRVGNAVEFPNEYPGQNYAFNWALNGDGVTPTKKSAFRITKPLDLRIAGLDQPKTSPLKVKSAKDIFEAGSDNLPFETFDDVSQRVKDALSISNHLYCPEGHAPTTRIGVRVISNSPTLSPDLLAYLERAPRKEPPQSQDITVYLLENATEEFAGYAIEIVEEEDEGGNPLDAKSVSSVVISGKQPMLETVVAGIEMSVAGITADAAESEAAEDAKE